MKKRKNGYGLLLVKYNMSKTVRDNYIHRTKIQSLIIRQAIGFSSVLSSNKSEVTFNRCRMNTSVIEQVGGAVA